MQNCFQTETQSVYQHGISVRDHLRQLIQYLETNKLDGVWKIPDWFIEYREDILKNLFPKEIIDEYALFHDVGKPYCIQYDENGKRHFPNHAEVSYQKWLENGGNKIVANLIRWDMKIHTIKADEIDEFIQHPETITLLLAGLAEIHSNAKMFGGLNSTS